MPKAASAALVPVPVPPIGPRMEYFPAIPGVFQAFPTIHGDLRGSFMEIFREDLLGTPFVQANHSRSRAGVLRGLHHHAKQSDAWYVIGGEAQVVLADLRDPSHRPCVVSVILRAAEPSVLLIPPGVAHGFLALTDVDLIYWVTHGYDSTDEFGVAWDDPALGAPWARTDPILSGRDQANPRIAWRAEWGTP